MLGKTIGKLTQWMTLAVDTFKEINVAATHLEQLSCGGQTTL
jgi:hypothetical protein